MCTTASILKLLLTIALVGSLGLSIVLAARLRSRLEAHHPGTWRWLGEWKFRWPDGEVQEAALPEFLWSNMYRSLEDPELNRFAFHVKVAIGSCIATVLALMLLGFFRPASSLLGCLGS
jgi:hypothetical protein